MNRREAIEVMFDNAGDSCKYSCAGNGCGCDAHTRAALKVLGVEDLEMEGLRGNWR